ncbi:hypothetical protein MMIC_P1580 [Mariprofundus micogutta]|uniref:Uncharacterized protein n=1 Tax=Mariprofundus micogutta TaxID=1921010 RepID=A0A1L8CNY3_9PROT|nr:hypothetical protein [Mariprofundus micogutta]GAV20608.1 hypothetical protein MMIC_P1580 [Mariprofundus micogutta]
MRIISAAEMGGESGKKFSAERFINPNKDVRTTMTHGYSEQLDDLVHSQMFANLDLWEALTYRDGGLRRIKTIHAFVNPPVNYPVEDKIPELPITAKRSLSDYTKGPKIVSENCPTTR